ncbi:MAG TPA: SIS domain-containing protein, partial [Limnochordales bacterium]
LKHGTLALIEEGRPVVALSTQRALQAKMLGNIQEVKARGARVVGVTLKEPERVAAMEKACDAVIAVPPVSEELAPAVAVVPLQLLAYHAAVARGCDVDRPRNLAKSVTVE